MPLLATKATPIVLLRSIGTGAEYVEYVHCQCKTVGCYRRKFNYVRGEPHENGCKRKRCI